MVEEMNKPSPEEKAQHYEDNDMWFAMTEEQLKRKYDGQICDVCGKSFNFQVVDHGGGSTTIYPHGIWESRKQWVKRNWFWILMTPLLWWLYLPIGIYYLYWRFSK